MNMLKVLGEVYIIDLDTIQEVISLPDVSGTSEQNISIVKYELIKSMIDVLMTENEDLDENLGTKGQNNLSIPFKLAFNTLLAYEILKNI